MRNTQVLQEFYHRYLQCLVVELDNPMPPQKNNNPKSKSGQVPCTCKHNCKKGMSKIWKRHYVRQSISLYCQCGEKTSMLLLSWCGAYHIKSVLRWLPLGDHHSTCENINMKFSVLRSCAPIHHMIMTIPWPWPPYHHHHDFNHLYPPQLQNRRNIFRTSTETIYHPIFTLTLAITKGHHNGVTGRRQGIRQAGGGQPLRSMMEMMFGWQGLFED